MDPSSTPHTSSESRCQISLTPRPGQRTVAPPKVQRLGHKDEEGSGAAVPIRVRRLTLHLVDLPLVSRFRTAYGTTTTKRTVLVRLEDEDGVVGWGEAPGADQPLYAPDTTESSWYALR